VVSGSPLPRDSNRSPTDFDVNWSVPMTIRTVVTAFAVLLMLQTSPVAADDIAPDSDASWISFSETSLYSTKQQEFHARATRNVDPKLLRIFSAHVSRATDLRLLMKSYTDAELKFRSDNFLVTRIDGTNVTIAVGKEFPEQVTRNLAKQLQTMGFHVDSVPPATLLHRNDSKIQDEPQFVVPYDVGSHE
jgi:hypothetical protein